MIIIIMNKNKNYFQEKALKTRNNNFKYYIKIYMYLQVKSNHISASLSRALSLKH